MGQPAVARANVDGDPARVTGQELSESVIRAFESLAAHDVHGIGSLPPVVS